MQTRGKRYFKEGRDINNDGLEDKSQRLAQKLSKLVNEIAFIGEYDISIQKLEKNKSKELHNHEYLHEKDTGNVHYLNEEKKKRTIRATKLNYRSSIRVDKISESTGAKRPAGIIRGTSSYLGGDKANMVDIDNVSKKGKLTAPYNTEIYGKSSTAFGSKPKGKDTTICIKNIEPSGLVWGFVPEFDKKGFLAWIVENLTIHKNGISEAELELADYLDEINYPKEKKENHIDMDMDVLAKHNNEVTTFSNLEQPELLSKYSTSTVHMDDLSKVILPREDWYDSSYLNILDEIKELKDEIETETNTLNLLTIKQMEMNTSLQKMENTLRQLETEENEEINIQSGYKMASEFDDHLKETVLELQYLSDSLQEDIDFNSFKDREISKSDYKSVFQYIDVTAKSITNTFNQECKDLDMFPSNAVKKLPNVSRFSGMQGYLGFCLKEFIDLKHSIEKLEILINEEQEKEEYLDILLKSAESITKSCDTKELCNMIIKQPELIKREIDILEKQYITSLVRLPAPVTPSCTNVLEILARNMLQTQSFQLKAYQELIENELHNDASEMKSAILCFYQNYIEREYRSIQDWCNKLEYWVNKSTSVYVESKLYTNNLKELLSWMSSSNNKYQQYTTRIANLFSQSFLICNKYHNFDLLYNSENSDSRQKAGINQYLLSSHFLPDHTVLSPLNSKSANYNGRGDTGYINTTDSEKVTHKAAVDSTLLKHESFIQTLCKLVDNRWSHSTININLNTVPLAVLDSFGELVKFARTLRYKFNDAEQIASTPTSTYHKNLSNLFVLFYNTALDFEISSTPALELPPTKKKSAFGIKKKAEICQLPDKSVESHLTSWLNSL